MREEQFSLPARKSTLPARKCIEGAPGNAQHALQKGLVEILVEAGQDLRELTHIGNIPLGELVKESLAGGVLC